MAHNYYLYEAGGKLNLIPWDYNLALGGMGGGNDATSVVNDAIDNAFSSTEFFDTLMEDEAYHSQYYEYLQQLVSEYIDGGGFDAFYERVRSQIDELVETDPTAFYSYDEYQTAADTLYQVVKLRGESIQGQLDGTIPSTESEQSNSSALIDASSLNLSVMGSMNNGGRSDFNEKNRFENTESEQNAAQSDSESSTVPDTSAGGNGGQPSDFAPTQFGGEMPDGFDPSKFGGGGQRPSNDTQTNEDSQNGGNGDFGSRPSMDDFPNGISGSTSTAMSSENLVMYGVSLAVIIAAILFAVLYRRKPRK